MQKITEGGEQQAQEVERGLGLNQWRTVVSQRNDEGKEQKVLRNEWSPFDLHRPEYWKPKTAFICTECDSFVFHDPIGL